MERPCYSVFYGYIPFFFFIYLFFFFSLSLSKSNLFQRQNKCIARSERQNTNAYAFSNCNIRANSWSAKREKQTHWMAHVHACTRVHGHRSWRVKSNRPRTINTPLTTFASKWTHKAGPTALEHSKELQYSRTTFHREFRADPKQIIHSKEHNALGHC